MKRNKYTRRVLAITVASVFWGAVTFAQPPDVPDGLFWLGFPGSSLQAERGARQGSAVAVGDFNCDGLGDLAMSAPYDDVIVGVPTITAVFEMAGSVTIVYGTHGGLGTDTQVLTEINFGATFPIAELDFFGESLATGDFDGDQCDDLAIGVPHRDIDGAIDAGAVVIAVGAPDGLLPRAVLFQGSPVFGIPDLVQAGEVFGYSIAAGDVDGDGYDEIVVGSPHQNIAGVSNIEENAGAIFIIRGAAMGIATSGHQFISRQTSGVPGSPQRVGQFGWAVAVGKGFNLEGRADVFVTEPGREVGGAIQAGSVLRILNADTRPIYLPRSLTKTALVFPKWPRSSTDSATPWPSVISMQTAPLTLRSGSTNP